MDRQRFKHIARDVCKLTHLTDKRLDEMYDEAQRNIEAYKIAHPAEWAAEEERAQMRAQQREAK